MFGSIYKITNLINGKCYIGQTSRSIEQRWKDHKRNSGRLSFALSLALQKYGRENFIIEEIFSAFDQNSLDFHEKLFIIQFNSLAPNGYNLTSGGEHPILSKETREKISKSHIGKIMSKETRAKMSSSKKGLPSLRLGKKFSEESLKKFIEKSRGTNSFQ